MVQVKPAIRSCLTAQDLEQYEKETCTSYARDYMLECTNNSCTTHKKKTLDFFFLNDELEILLIAERDTCLDANPLHSGKREERLKCRQACQTEVASYNKNLHVDCYRP